MSQKEIIKEVQCPITDAKFTLVREEIPESLTLFQSWCLDLLQRANNRKFINIAIDCEGFSLGTIEHSLGCIQIGEIFNDSYSVRSGLDPPPVGTNPGYIIISPINNTIRQYISAILCHPFTLIYTFDFTKDFSSMMEAGISINLNNVFDSQVATLYNIPNHIFNTKVRGLKWFVNQAIRMDPLAEKANEKINNEKHSYFDVIMFLSKDKENPFQEMMSEELFEMASSDIYMTGLAAVYCIKSNLTENVFIQTNQKAIEFYQFSAKCQNYLAPGIAREVSFFNYFRSRDYNQQTDLKDETEEDLLELLKVFRETYALISAARILKTNYNGIIPPEKALEINQNVSEKLNANRSRLEQMLIRFS